MARGGSSGGGRPRGRRRPDRRCARGRGGEDGEDDGEGDPALHDAVQRWASAELRSFNGQVEFILRRALAAAVRLPPDETEADGAKES